MYVLGDFNAKTGIEDEHRPIIGNHSLHSITSNNGIKLIDFAAERDMMTGNYNSETVDNFAYLGVYILNVIGAEIKSRIIAANSCLHDLRAFLKSKLNKGHTKIRLYETTIRLLHETWTLTKSQTEQPAIFEF
ncbi:hypothetical protein TNCV_4010711 [Trichonephila clavipes]|nr:hypothetical protein TNCV_4010711 [Trichonephila clavipes]